MDFKHLMAQEVISEVVSFYQDIHTRKVEFINEQLKKVFCDKDSFTIKDVTDSIELIDSSAGLSDQLSTVYRRDKFLKTHFDFIKPQLNPLGNFRGVPCFYYSLPINRTLSRFLENDTMRRFMVHTPLFFNHNGSKHVYRHVHVLLLRFFLGLLRLLGYATTKDGIL